VCTFSISIGAENLVLQALQFSDSQSHVSLKLTASQSVCLGGEPRLGLMTKYLFIFL
jgi:hypothetical protein